MTGSLTEALVAHVLRAGFDAAGVTSADLPAIDRQAFDRWLDAGQHADMHHLRRHQRLRQDGARALLDGAHSVLVACVSYAWPDLRERQDLAVARYAQSQDYHKALRKNLSRAIRSFARRSELGLWRVCVDSAPLLERAYARGAGLGFVGRNSLIISPRLGSYILLAAVIMEAELATQTARIKAFLDDCGSCRACVSACPAQAIVDDGVVDARRCLSYCSIERRDVFDSPPPPLGHRIFGCDRCQEVCPHNRQAEVATGRLLRHRPRLAALDAGGVLSCDDAELQHLVAGTPLRRAGLAGLRRNAREVLGWGSQTKE